MEGERLVLGLNTGLEMSMRCLGVGVVVDAGGAYDDMTAAPVPTVPPVPIDFPVSLDREYPTKLIHATFGAHTLL